MHLLPLLDLLNLIVAKLVICRRKPAYSLCAVIITSVLFLIMKNTQKA